MNRIAFVYLLVMINLCCVNCTINEEDERNLKPRKSLPSTEQKGGNEGAALVDEGLFEANENIEHFGIVENGDLKLVLNGSVFRGKEENRIAEPTRITMTLNIDKRINNLADFQELEGKNFLFREAENNADISSVNCVPEVGLLRLKKVDTVRLPKLYDWRKKQKGLIVSGEFYFGNKDPNRCNITQGWFDYSIPEEKVKW